MSASSTISLNGPPDGLSVFRSPSAASQQTFLGLLDIPLHDIRLGNPDILRQLHSALTTAAQLQTLDRLRKQLTKTYSPNDKDLGRPARLFLTRLERLPHGRDQQVLIGIGGFTRQSLALGMSQLPRPILDSQRRTCSPSEPNHSNTHGDNYQHIQPNSQKLENASAHMTRHRRANAGKSHRPLSAPHHP
jgi:hypothetical protein